MVISLSKLYPFLSSSILFSVFISVLCQLSYHTGHLTSPLRFYEFVVSVNFPWESSTQNCQTSVFHYSIPVCFLISPVIYSSLFSFSIFMLNLSFRILFIWWSLFCSYSSKIPACIVHFYILHIFYSLYGLYKHRHRAASFEVETTHKFPDTV